MKKIYSLLLVVTMMLSICACGKGEKAEDFESQSTENTQSAENITIEGLYVDNSYTTSTSDTTKMLYIVYEAHTDAENMQIDCKSMNITFEELNSYDACRTKNQVRYMPNYYNGAYLKKVNIGESAKFVETFEVPEAELAPNRTITISKSQIPGCDKLKLSTNDIVFCNSAEEVGAKADPEGCEKEKWSLQDADEATITAVKSEINGYQWDITANKLNYEIEFFAPNSFEIRTAVSTAEGKYEVKNGYIICTNSIGGVVEIPYTNNNGKIDVDIISAFDVMK